MLAELYLQRNIAQNDLGQKDEAFGSVKEAERIAAAVAEPSLEARVAAQLGQRLRVCAVDGNTDTT